MGVWNSLASQPPYASIHTCIHTHMNMCTSTHKGQKIINHSSYLLRTTGFTQNPSVTKATYCGENTKQMLFVACDARKAPENKLLKVRFRVWGWLRG